MKIVGSSQMYLSIFLSFQIVDYLVVVVGNHSQFLARPHLAATAARLEVLLLCAPSDRAHRAAERRFYALNPAAGAVNHLGQDFGIVQLRPWQPSRAACRRCLWWQVAPRISRSPNRSMQYMSSLLLSFLKSDFLFSQLESAFAPVGISRNGISGFVVKFSRIRILGEAVETDRVVSV